MSWPKSLILKGGELIKRIRNVVIAVKDIDDALRVYADLFGLHPEPQGVHETPGTGAKVVVLPPGRDSFIEFIQPTVGPDHPQGGVLAKFIARRGEGLYNISLEVDNVNEELKRLADKGVALIDKEARTDLPVRIGFIHPSATMGTLIALVEGEPEGGDVVKRFHHVGIVVKDIEAALSCYADLFGFKLGRWGVFELPGLNAAMLRVGDAAIELMQPTVSPDHPHGDLARFLQSRGEGLHHLALLADNIPQELQRLRAKGVQVQVTESQLPEELAKQIGMRFRVQADLTKGVTVEVIQRRG